MAPAVASACFILGLAAVTLGVWLIFPAAGLIVGGILIAAVSVFFVRGSRVLSR